MGLRAEDPVLLRRVAQQLEKHAFKGWFYGDSVGFEGLVAAGDMLPCITGRADRRTPPWPIV